MKAVTARKMSIKHTGAALEVMKPVKNPSSAAVATAPVR